MKSDFQWSPHENKFNTYNTGITLKNFRGDSLYSRYGYDRFASESLYTRLNTKLTSNIRAFAVYEQNLMSNKTIEKKAGFRFNRPCWSMRISYSDTPDDRVFSFMVNLHGIGEFGTK